MSDYGTVTEAGTVRFERLLPEPIERVWAYLTESDKRGTWLATGTMDLRVGGRVELHFKHADLSPTAEEITEPYKEFENGASFEGGITRCEPPWLLSHTWVEAWGGASQVTYELSPRGDEVLLVLTHRRLPTSSLVSVASGWHTHLGVLLDHLSGRDRQPFWSTHTRFADEYRQRLATT